MVKLLVVLMFCVLMCGCKHEWEAGDLCEYEGKIGTVEFASYLEGTEYGRDDYLTVRYRDASSLTIPSSSFEECKFVPYQTSDEDTFGARLGELMKAALTLFFLTPSRVLTLLIVGGIIWSLVKGTKNVITKDYSPVENGREKLLEALEEEGDVLQ